MTIRELHKKLIEAYSVNNLNTISFTLINLFKNRQFSSLQKIADIISEYVEVNIGKDGKGFNKLMMLYHPDRAVYHISEINRLAAREDYEGLLAYSHIFKLDRIEEIASSIRSYDDIDYAPVYSWDIEDEEDLSGFTIIDINKEKDRGWDKYSAKREGYTFYDALKLRVYGDIDIEYPSYYIEYAEDVELSSSDIIDLEGVQFCTHARFLDISDNRISDLFPLAGLNDLEELNLSDNEVEILDDLIHLKKLRSVMLSNNNIEDISPLFFLKNLEYADLSGNKIDFEQIERLAERGVNVDY
jgi:Leucine-rich repeat (LRR) protein